VKQTSLLLFVFPVIRLHYKAPCPMFELSKNSWGLGQRAPKLEPEDRTNCKRHPQHQDAIPFQPNLLVCGCYDIIWRKRILNKYINITNKRRCLSVRSRDDTDEHYAFSLAKGSIIVSHWVYKPLCSVLSPETTQRSSCSVYYYKPSIYTSN